MSGSWSIVDVIIPQEVQGGVLTAMGGAGIVALSSLLPGTFKPVGMVGGVIVAGFGIHKVYRHLFGDPEKKTVVIPSQSLDSLSKVSGNILTPADGGSVELSNMWGAAVGAESNRTYKIVFQVFNDSEDDLILPIEFAVDENKTLLPNKTTKVTYVVEVPGKRKGTGMSKSSKITTGWQPVSAVLMGGINASGKLILKGPTAVEDRILATVKFSI
jgi:hypothetical protein